MLCLDFVLHVTVRELEILSIGTPSTIYNKLCMFSLMCGCD